MVMRKVVLRLSVQEMKKRSKALKLSAGFPGVLSAGLQGDLIIVVGKEIDSVTLVIALRKKFGFVELVRVAAVTEEDEFEDRTGELDKYWNGKNVQPYMSPIYGYNGYNNYINPQQTYLVPQQQYVYDVPHSNNDSSCNIM